MFATLLGPYPRPATAASATAASADDLVRSVLAEQEAAGLGLLCDGGLRSPDPIGSLAGGLDGFEVTAGRVRAVAEPRWRGPVLVEAWRSTAALTELPVKQAIVGPYTLARRVDAGATGRVRLTLALAEALREELRALAEAGCPVIQVDEDDAALVGLDPSERRIFVDAQRRLTDGIDAHLSLAIAGGDAAGAGAETIFDPPYRSYLFDLVAGPDHWRLIAQAPADRGIVCGALDPAGTGSGDRETLVWAARYAASTRGRGMDRVGLAPAAGLERLSWEAAGAKVRVLGDAARLATAPREELEEALDWRALDRPWDRGKKKTTEQRRRSPAP